MKCLMILVLIASASARILNKNDCEGVVVNGISHTKEILKEYVDKPYQLAIDYNTNILYFSYTTKDSSDIFAIGYINLKTNEFGTISGVTGGFANGVDENTHSVYFGGSNGIYKLNPGTNRATNLGITTENVWQLFYKENLFFTTYPEEKAYVYKNNVVRQVPELANTRAMLIGIDNAHNIVFSNSSGLFVYSDGSEETTHIGDHTLNSITKDINGNLFFSSPTALYSFDGKTKEVKKLVTIINIYGMVIESDGSIIYASENKIIRLKNTGKECGVDLEVKQYN